MGNVAATADEFAPLTSSNDLLIVLDYIQRIAPPGVHGDKRAAYYVSTAALADPTGTVVAVVEGRCWGRVAMEPTGSGGFGYDPLFVIPEYHASFGELSNTVKHALSHRGRAIGMLRQTIRQRLLG